MQNTQVAALLDQIADLLEFQNANPFRVRAYRNGARSIAELQEPVAAILDDPDRKLTDLPGLGKDLAEKVETILATGTLPMLEELKAQVPESVFAMVRIPGVGPKKAAALFNQLKITTLDELRAACMAEQVRDLKGFGKKTEETILAGIDLASHAEDRMYWAQADVIVQQLLAYMRALPEVRQAEVAGSYRRGKETIGDLDLLVEADDVERVMDCFGEFEHPTTVIARGDTKMSIRLGSNLQIDLRVVPEKSFGAALQYFTGSKEHNVVLRGLAKQHGLKISEYGVFRVSDHKEKYLAGRTEAEIYAALDLPLFPPEIREARQEFEWAAAGALPELIEVGDLRGDLHMHTNETDGTATLEEMVEAAQARGLKYIAITDHSKRVTMANGLDGKRLRKQWAAIDKLNDKLKGIVVLKGVECDILEKGGMDLPDDVLAEADWVVASIHYGQKQPREQITERMLGAIENPYVSVIGHPTGRILNRRPAYEIDLDAVFRAAKKHRKLMELNANPARLDLDDLACATAKRHGVPIVISTDAHSPDGLDVMRYGVLQARRAGLTKADVANTRTWAQIKKLMSK